MNLYVHWLLGLNQFNSSEMKHSSSFHKISASLRRSSAKLVKKIKSTELSHDFIKFDGFESLASRLVLNQMKKAASN